ncbi:hypothetical protein KC19_10G065200 [Ceratodon purpureus]|uniref:Uncharacterized protein n=1 Tax=Ceratodon purpureus TaxID=3225 RepID=A0A8T0GMF8_CERPU|nr:hypothetical protein KC19_10G065200 [Ceratodon purpureus]
MVEMDKCYTLVCVVVFLGSIIHGFTVGVRNGNRIGSKVGVENITLASEGSLSDRSGVTRQSLRISETEANSTFGFIVLQTGPDPAITAAMDNCVKALKQSTEQVEAVAAAFESFDATAQGQAFDDFRAQMNAAVEISRSCFKDCFVELSFDDWEAVRQLQSVCARQLQSHIQVWVDAEELYSQYLDLEFNRAQITRSTSWWSTSSNSSDVSEP